ANHSFYLTRQSNSLKRFTMPYQHLTGEQVEHFLTYGYIVLPGCVSPATAREWADRAFTRLGYKADDPSTWKQSRIIMTGQQQVEVKEFAPKAWAATCDLVGGEDRVTQPYQWSDGFIV